MAESVNAGARLDRLPTSSFHRRILWLIGGGMFLDSFDIYLAGGVLGALVDNGWSNMQSNAAFLSSTFVGMLIGAFCAGMLGDAKGRKFTYQFNLAIFGIASLAGAVAPSMDWLIVCRFFMGLGLGAEIVVGYGSIGEFIPPAVRGRWGSYLSLITNTALFVSTFLGYLLIPTVGWRAMFAIVGIGALVIWVLRRKMPESPRWLESKGRLDEAEAIVAEAEAESCPAGQTLPPVERGRLEPVAATTVFGLFKPPLLHRTVLSIAIQVAVNIVIYGFIVWVPTFLVDQGVAIKSSLGYTTLMSLGGPVGAFVGVLVADRFGRKRSLIAVAVVAAITGWLYSQSSSIAVATFLGFILFSSTYLMVALGLAVYIPELFPTENRMRGSGVAGAAGRIASIVAPQMVVGVYLVGGVNSVMAVISAVLAAFVVLLVLLGVETKGLPLERTGDAKR